MGVLSAERVSFSYVDGVPVLSDVSLKVESSERVALRAPSGFGKSTLCQILAGYLAPDEGRVLLDGVPVSVTKGLPNPVQLIWQHPEMTLDPYLRIQDSLAEVGEVTDELLEGLGVKPAWLERFPHELSGGELQRCCIARVLALSPRFVIADESTTMLDAITQVQIWEFLMTYCARHRIGLVVVTHSDALLKRLATRVVDLV